MYFEPGHIYHVYNRGNNKVKIFFNQDNYLYLLHKIRKEWRPYCDIICYCLMPNHFHFMLRPKEAGFPTLVQKGLPSHLQVLSKTIGKTLSSYTQAINNQNKTIGTLFQKKTKAKCLTDHAIIKEGQNHANYLLNCFHYIHNNPLKAKLVTDATKWPFSSWPDYFDNRNGTLCNRSIITETTGLSYKDLVLACKNPQTDEDIIKRIW